MWEQIAIGSALVFVTTAAHGVGTVLALHPLTRVQHIDQTHTGRGTMIGVLVMAMFLVSVADAVL